MIWTGTIFGSQAEMFEGVEGYFGVQGITTGGGVPTTVIANTPTQVIFGVDNNLGRISFFGTGLTVGTVPLPIGTSFPVFTSGTLTGAEVFFNHRLSDAINAGIFDPALTLPSLLEPSAVLSFPNISAVDLSASIVASYQARAITPVRNFFNEFNHVYTGTDGVNLMTGFDNDDHLIGLGGDDFLQGEGGNDTLDGGPGTDGLNGGPGSDLYLPGPPSPSNPVGDSVSDSGTAAGEIDTLSYANATGPVVVDLNFADGDQSAGWARGLVVGGIEQVIGSNFSDILHGSATPGSEADTLIGGPGDDTLWGYAGSDVLQGGPGFDELIGGENGGILGGGPGDAARFAASSAEIDVFFQPDGSVLVAAPGGGVDRLIQMEFLMLTDGVFNIGAFGASGRNLVIGDAENNRLDGSANGDRLFGRAGNDTLVGLGGADTLEGDVGNDRLAGGGGDDLLFGGDGTDIAVLTAGMGRDIFSDFILGTDGFDTVALSSEMASSIENVAGSTDRTLRLSDGGELVFAGLQPNFTPEGEVGIGGTAVDGNTLTADTSGITDRDGVGMFSHQWLRNGTEISGATGASYTLGSADVGSQISVRVRYTDDFFTIETLTSAPTGAVSLATIELTGTAGADNLDGAENNDTLRGLDGNDRLRGMEGNDSLDGGLGTDTLNGGAGDDTIIGGPGDGDLRDQVFAGAGNDSVDAGAGNDQVFGQGGNDTIAGGAGVDDLQGQDGDDVITGSNFSDLVFGGAGDDFVNGGFGSDRINGGTGADKFFHVGVRGHGSDWLQDYTSAEGDVLLWGGGAATAEDFQVNFAHTENAEGERAGEDDVTEGFVIHRPTGQIIWALVDGGGQDAINIQIGSEVFDLLM